jgi:adenylate cyclase class IV
MAVEVELRAFITEEEYEALIATLSRSSKLVEHTRQITHYLDTLVDTRIQVSTSGGRVWQKLGQMHDPAREELEILMSKQDARRMLRIFENIGVRVKVAWFRERHSFLDGPYRISLDETIGYGRILEVELQCERSDVPQRSQDVLGKLHALGLEPTERTDFDNAYSEYLRSWRERTAGLDFVWLESL